GDTKTPASSRSPFAEQLSRQRLAPLEPLLKDIRHLIVLPSEELSGLPLEALTDRFTISYAPSGTMLARLREKRRSALGTGGKKLERLLALGDPIFRTTKTDPVFVSLPGTRREVEVIAPLFPQADRLLGADAGKVKLTALEKDLGRYDVLHL